MVGAGQDRKSAEEQVVKHAFIVFERFFPDRAKRITLLETQLKKQLSMQKKEAQGYLPCMDFEEQHHHRLPASTASPAHLPPTPPSVAPPLW